MAKKIILIFLLIAGCSGKDYKTKIVVTGSETMHVMMEHVSDAYMKKNHKVDIRVEGGGSLHGIRRILEHKTDIAVSSKPLEIEEIKRLEFNNKLFETITVAYDGIAIITSQNNQAGKITFDRLTDVFSGKITNWNQLGGENRKIQVVIRNDNSGTSWFFRNYILKKKYLGEKEYLKNAGATFAYSAKIVSNNDEMADYINSTPGAIGYMGMGSALVENRERIKTLAFAMTDRDPFVMPNAKTVFNREYKLTRGLYLIYKPDHGYLDDFVTYITSKEGQNVIMQSGYLKSALDQVEVKEYID